jgi:hypothetical protein
LRPLKSRPQDEASKSLLVDSLAAVRELDHTTVGDFVRGPPVVRAKIKLGWRPVRWRAPPQRKRLPTEAASIQAPAEFLDNLPQIVDVLLDDPARIL